MTTPPSPGATIAGRYSLEARVAVGGMGEVWRARDEVLSRTVAVKLLKPEYVADPTFLERFRNEAKHTAALADPGIANTFDYGEVGDTAFLVMEFVEGEPLSAILAREGRLPPDRALDVVGQAALALHSAHVAGVIHRDVKPANLIVRADGVVKVTDFGVARAASRVPLTQTGLVVGTAAYLSPEQAAGREVTPASDIYALGLVAYECLAGRRAFDGDTPIAVATAQVHQPPPSLPKDVPPLVADFVLRALEKDPSRRYGDAGDFGRTALALAATMREGAAVAQQGPTGTALLTAAAAPAERAAAAEAPVGAAATVAAADRAADAHRRRVRNAFVAVGTGVVLLGFLLLRACDTTSSGRGAHPQPSAHATHATTVTVRAGDYVGRPAAQVTDTLRAAGLVVRRESIASGSPAGSVVGVSPTGNLPHGATVTLQVASPPPAAPRPRPHKHGHGGNGDG